MYLVTMKCVVLLMLLSVVSGQYYDTFSGKKTNRTRYEQFERNSLVPVCAMTVRPCNPHAPRRMDLTCNNLRYPTRGASYTPFSRMLPPVFSEGGDLRRARSGKPLPNARPLRVALMSDGRRHHRRHTHMLTNYMVFITGETTSVHDTVNYVAYTRTCCQPAGELHPQCMPVKVEDDDVHLRRSNVRCMNLTRAITYQQLQCVSDEIPRERINLAAPLLDLSGVYGHSGSEAERAREYKGGRLRAIVINGREWPPSGGTVCVNNVPPRETHCHDSPSRGANSLLGINLLFMWYYRNHNAIAAALHELNPCWDDNRLYYTAREINIAFCNQIFYYELMPEVLGLDFLRQNKLAHKDGHINDYDANLEPRLTAEYNTATRWFHTLQHGVLGLYKPDGRLYGSVPVVDMILRSGALAVDDNIAGVTQGSFREPGGDVDDVVDPDVGERILGRLQFASDVIASDIMKGRDFGLPPYNQYRKACRLPIAKTFKDLLGWMDKAQVQALATMYEHPDDIDLMVALLTERVMPDSIVGPTLGCIMAQQLLTWRRADRFWYEHSGHPGAFSTEQLREIRKMTLAKLLCQHGDSVSAVQPQAFVLPGAGNEITSCAKYEMPDLSVFRDARCYPHPTSFQKEYLDPTPFQREYLDPTPRDKEYQPPTLRYDDRTTLKDYLTDILGLNQNKPLINNPNTHSNLEAGYPKTDFLVLSYPDRYSDPTSPKHGNDAHTKLINNVDPTSKHGYNERTKLVHFNNDPTVSINQDPTVGHNYDPTLVNAGHLTSLFPKEDPNVKIYPNADPIEPNSKILEAISIPGYSNLNSGTRDQNIEYRSVHPTLRNQNYPFEEVLQNYWQSSQVNPYSG